MASKTGWTSVGEVLITRKISLVAVCCSCSSTRRVSRSWTLEPSLFRALRAIGGLGLILGLVGFALRRIDPSLLLTEPYDRAVIDDRLGEDAPLGKWAGRVPVDACEHPRALGRLIHTSAGSVGGWGRPAGNRS